MFLIIRCMFMGFVRNAKKRSNDLTLFRQLYVILHKKNVTFVPNKDT